MSLKIYDKENNEINMRDVVKENYNLDDLLMIKETKNILENDSYFNFERIYGNKIKKIYEYYSDTYENYNFLDNDKSGYYELMDTIYSHMEKEYDINLIYDDDILVIYLYNKLVRGE